MEVLDSWPGLYPKYLGRNLATAESALEIQTSHPPLQVAELHVDEKRRNSDNWSSIERDEAMDPAKYRYNDTVSIYSIIPLKTDAAKRDTTHTHTHTERQQNSKLHKTSENPHRALLSLPYLQPVHQSTPSHSLAL